MPLVSEDTLAVNALLETMRMAPLLSPLQVAKPATLPILDYATFDDFIQEPPPKKTIKTAKTKKTAPAMKAALKTAAMKGRALGITKPPTARAAGFKKPPTGRPRVNAVAYYTEPTPLPPSVEAVQPTTSFFSPPLPPLTSTSTPPPPPPEEPLLSQTSKIRNFKSFIEVVLELNAKVKSAEQLIQTVKADLATDEIKDRMAETKIKKHEANIKRLQDEVKAEEAEIKRIKNDPERKRRREQMDKIISDQGNVLAALLAQKVTWGGT